MEPTFIRDLLTARPVAIAIARLSGAAQQAGVRDLLTEDSRMALNWRELEFIEAGTIG
jgi:hypothetical protein